MTVRAKEKDRRKETMREEMEVDRSGKQVDVVRQGEQNKEKE